MINLLAASGVIVVMGALLGVIARMSETAYEQEIVDRNLSDRSDKRGD